MTNKNGFTLVELAIALMVIGLLIGGVLKGQELIENARIVRMTKYMQDVDAAVMIFRNMYGNALPGDMRHAGRKLPNCTDDCAFMDSKTGDRKISAFGSSGSEYERPNFWRHLHRAGLITGIDDTSSRYCVGPLNALGGKDYVINYSSTAGYEGTVHWLRIADANSPSLYGVDCNADNSQITRVKAMDAKLDDGKPFTGSFRISPSQAAAVVCGNVDENEYLDVQPTYGCYAHMHLPSMK